MNFGLILLFLAGLIEQMGQGQRGRLAK